MIYKNFKFIVLFLLAASSCYTALAQQNLGEILSQAKVKAPRLSPLPNSVNETDEPLLSLNGEWNVSVENGPSKIVKVPGELIMQGIDLPTGQTAKYHRSFNIPIDWENKRVFIRFDAVSSQAEVFINGKTLGSHEGSFVPFEFEITEAIVSGSNSIQVNVKANTISDILACTSQYAAHTVAGILRKVTLFALPQTNLEDLTVQTLFDANYKNADLKIISKISNLPDETADFVLRFTLVDPEGKIILNKSSKIEVANQDEHTNSFSVKKPLHWTPETPNLYTLTTELLSDGETTETVIQKIGFREVKIQGTELLVNGKPVKLHGVNRHIVHPLSGRSIDPELERLDAKLFKEANCNYIRTSHYPPSEEFLQAADELGLFVESEASLTWIEHHASPIWEHWDYQDEKFLPYFLMANIENIQANKNHPSIIIWSIANESRWSPLWEKVETVVSQMDPTRPNSFHDQAWGGFNNAGSSTAIANYHYPYLDGPSRTDEFDRPVLFGEYAHLSTYNRRELLTDPGVRDAYNLPLIQLYDSMYVHKNNLGGAIWSGIDDTFHLPNGKIVGYGPWGPLDGWRRKKPEYYGMKKAYSPVRINQVVPSDKKVMLEVENRYDFTSFKDIKIEAEINGETKLIPSNIGSRRKGNIEIPLDQKLETLKITFWDPNGFIAEEELFQFATSAPPVENKKVKLNLSENPDAYIVQQAGITYTIDKLKGKIISVKKGNTEIFSEALSFAIVDMNGEDGGKVNIAGETYQRIINPLQTFPWFTKYASNIDVKNEADTIHFSIDITYKEGKGKIWHKFTSDGKFISGYELMKTGKESSPYQYGLLLQLPKSFDQLEWERKGDFTIYPKNHIGRNQGQAKLNAQQTSGVEPWREEPEHLWKDDANELGSNDFRSTKRNIIKASLSNGDTKVTVLSNANQSSRSWLQEENIHWLIADYSNNGSEPFYATPHSNGRITTKDRSLNGEIVLIIE